MPSSMAKGKKAKEMARGLDLPNKVSSKSPSRHIPATKDSWYSLHVAMEVGGPAAAQCQFGLCRPISHASVH